jgi:hypothetical protein
MISRRVFRALVIAGVVLLALLAIADVMLVRRRERFRQEIDRLRSSMTLVERARAAQIIAQERNRLRLAVELIRRQARVAPDLHLSIATDSSRMYLERDGVLLREMPVHIGPARRVGIVPDTVHLAAPRGARTVAEVLTDSSVWIVPEWVFADRGVPAPSVRAMRGALGTAAIVLTGGTVIYSLPNAGPLSDSTYVLPGAVRVREHDLRAILPNLKAGSNVYFF